MLIMSEQNFAYSNNETFILSSIQEAEKISDVSQKPMLVIFGSENCGYCTKLKNDLVSNVESSYIDPYIICYIDLNKNENLKKKYDISSIPDSRIFFKRKMKSSTKGYKKIEYLEWLDKNK